MSIQTEFQSTIANVQNAYQGLANLGATIPQNKTIENIKSCLDEIYNNAPKTSYAEGSNITLSNCLKGKLDYEDDKVGYGDTSQESTNGYQLIPYTLESLKTLNTSGTWNENVYTYSGITYTVEVENGYIKEIKTTGTATATSFMYLINSLTISAGTYYVSGCPNGGSVSTYFIYAGSGLNHNTSDTPTATILNEDVSLTSNNLRITVINGTNANNLIWKPMLSKTNTTTYEPYTGGIPAPNPTYPFPVKCVTGEQEVTIRGINLFDGEMEQGGISGSTGQGEESTARIRTKNYTKINSSQLILSIKESSFQTFVYCYDTNKAFLGYIGSAWNNIPYTFTVINNTSYIKFVIRKSDNGTIIPTDVSEIQLEEGSSATTYESYITPITKTLNLGSIELAKIGTYRDYIWTDRSTGKWYKHSAIGKVVLNGTETWYKSGNTSNNGYLGSVDSVISNALKPANNGINANVLSNYFISYSVNSLLSNGLIGIGMRSDGIICIGTSLSGISVLTGFTNWLSTHNTEFRYPLATATDTPITDTTFIEQAEEIYNNMSLNGTTIIEINGSLPMIMKCRALKKE